MVAVTGMNDEAKAQLEAALKLDPRSAMTHWRLGEVLEHQGNHAGADTEYRSSLALDGDLVEERQGTYERFKKKRR